MSIAVEEITFGNETWVALRGAGKEMVGWLKPNEAAELGRALTSKYGRPAPPAVKPRGKGLAP